MLEENFSDIPGSLVEYIVEHTGLDRESVLAVLRAERKYYIEKLYSIMEDTS